MGCARSCGRWGCAVSEHAIGQWYVHTTDTRLAWHSEVRVNVGPAAYETVALCRRVTEQRKDAALIAAAPALLAALERFGTHSFNCQAQLNWREADDLAADDPACDCDLAETIRMARGEVPS